MVAFFEQARLAESELFRDRVKVAVFIAARDIVGEVKADLSSTQYGKRQELARQVLGSPDGLVDRFAWAVAVNPGLAQYDPVEISSSTNEKRSVVSTVLPHGLGADDTVVIADHLLNTSINGPWRVIDVPSDTAFVIAAVGLAAGGASGSVTRQVSDSDIQFTVNSVFNDIAGISGLD